MKSNYLQCDDIEEGEKVLLDEKFGKPNKVLVIWLGEVFATVEGLDHRDRPLGHRWQVMRNRLTKIKKESNIKE